MYMFYRSSKEKLEKHFIFGFDDTACTAPVLYGGYTPEGSIVGVLSAASGPSGTRIEWKKASKRVEISHCRARASTRTPRLALKERRIRKRWEFRDTEIHLYTNSQYMLSYILYLLYLLCYYIRPLMIMNIYTYVCGRARATA